MRKQLQSGGDMSISPNDSAEETTAVFPPTYIVVQFSRHVRTKALMWLVDKICGKRLDGGAELLVRRQPHLDGQVCSRVLVQWVTRVSVQHSHRLCF
jgi:hypothetical protein